MDVKTTRRVQIALPSTGDEEWHALREPLASGWLTQGPRVAAFEQAFAVRHQVKFALATTSCTTALHLALAALDIGPGDEVIVPSLTMVATAFAVSYLGATPIPVDSEPRTGNMDVEKIRARITPRTKAILPVHLYGHPVDMDPLLEIAEANDLHIVEDAAESQGA